LERKERNKNITAGVVAGGVLAGGLTFVAFMKNIFKKNIILGIQYAFRLPEQEGVPAIDVLTQPTAKTA